MNDKFISDRITQLRLAKGDSEYHVSLEIGRSRTYIGMITSGKAVPSMRVFLAICEYFDISPAQFFAPYLTPEVSKIAQSISELTEQDIACLLHRMTIAAIKDVFFIGLIVLIVLLVLTKGFGIVLFRGKKTKSLPPKILI